MSRGLGDVYKRQNTFSIIPDALGKDDKVFMGDLDIESIAKELNEDGV